MEISIDSCSKVNEFTITLFSKWELHGNFYRHLMVKDIRHFIPKKGLTSHGNFYRLFWRKIYNTYSLFEQMYGNFHRYLVVKIICSFCPKRYMEITVKNLSHIARSSNWDIHENLHTHATRKVARFLVSLLFSLVFLGFHPTIIPRIESIGSSLYRRYLNDMAKLGKIANTSPTPNHVLWSLR